MSNKYKAGDDILPGPVFIDDNGKIRQIKSISFIRCYRCGREFDPQTDKAQIDWLLDYGECLSCDHIKGDLPYAN